MNTLKQNNKIQTKHGEIALPAFLPDATYGSINSISFDDAKKADINEIVTTTLHLETKLGSKYIKDVGGLHKFFKWDRPILTDSGGFQVLSLINTKKNPNNKITETGAYFKDPGTGITYELTPEISQQIQFNLGSDIRVVLDEPTLPNLSESELAASVERTTRWAKRSKDEFLKLENLTEEEFNSNNQRTILGAVIQGGMNFKLREESYKQLSEIGFDSYNWGGATYDDKGFYKELAHFMAELIDDSKIKYAMGVGTPDDIVTCFNYGWELFDCVMPSRNARHGYLFVTKGEGNQDFENYSAMHIKSERYKYDDKPVDAECDCECCTKISRQYLRHLIRIKEASGYRFATIHNLRFYSRIIEGLRNENNKKENK